MISLRLSRVSLFSRWACLVALGAMALGPAKNAAGAIKPRPGKLVFEENFDALPDGPLPESWGVEGGEWRVEKGRLRARATTYLSCLTFPVGRELRDVAVEVDAAFLKAKNSSRWLALMVRSPRRQPAPFLIFTSRFDRSRGSGLEIGLNLPGKGGKRTWNILQRGRCDIGPETGKSHRLRFEVRGNLAVGFIDGRPVIESVLPAGAMMAGEVGLIVSDVTAVFDNLRVEALKPLTGREEEAYIMSRFAGPLVIGHRGDSRHAPENTLASFRQAFRKGADGVEMDLRKSRDGVLYLLHDKTLDRTTNGKGEAGARTIAELKTLDAGSWKDRKFAGERIPTFEEAARLCAKRGIMLLDLKEEGLLELIAAVVRKTGVLDRVVLCCWTDRQLADARKFLPDAVRVKLGSAPKVCTPGWFRTLRGKGAMGLSLAWPSITPDCVRMAAVAAMPMYVWTLNDRTEIRRAIMLGVTGLLVDDCALAVGLRRDIRKILWKSR